MPLSSSIVGSIGEPLESKIDSRWTMAYAAGVGDNLPCYMDTTKQGGVVAHPLFPVCFEWPVLLARRPSKGNELFTPEEARQGVHATHDLIIHRLVRPGDRLTTRLTVIGVEKRRPGAYQAMRMDTTDSSGNPVCTTYQGTIYRGVEVVDGDMPARDIPDLPELGEKGEGPRNDIAVPISGMAAHVYTECARIWNPIHTDAEVAARSGLPKILLHGTATLALAVSKIVELEAGNKPELVKRVVGRFGGMVFMPSEIKLRILSRDKTSDGDLVAFEVLNAEGQKAVQDGRLLLGY